MNRKPIGVMPSLNSVRPVQVNGGEEVVTVGGKDLESTREAEERSTREAEEAETGGEERNCLLYTSPSPRDGILSRMPSSA